MTSAAHFFWIDAFAEAPFAGNPAAVCLLEHELSDAMQQDLAAEFNLSETVFLMRLGADFAIRWFTPTLEVPLVGHATLAAAHAVLAHFAPDRSEVVFISRESGRLAARREAGGYAIELPSDTTTSCPIPADLVEGLGRVPVAVRRGRHYLAIFDDENAIADLKPDFAALTRLDLPTIIATAPSRHVDYVLRFFAPANGVPEDPVSGVAQCSLVPYWADRLGRSRLVSNQLSARSGRMTCWLSHGGVTIAGPCRTIAEGRLSPDFVRTRAGR